MEHTENQAVLRGSLKAPAVYSHENHGVRFYEFYLEVPRLSGTCDILPVVVPEDLLPEEEPGASLLVCGQIRSHNVHREDGRHLKIFLFGREVSPEEGPSRNDVTLTGTICRDPILRRTPLGREICDVMLAVPRGCHRADYLPCILWGRTAQEAARCRTRDQISICGRLQSRSYMKLTETGQQQRTAYEISAMTAEIPEDLY